MKLEVPFIKQTTDFNCGPVALQMIFSYFGGIESLDSIEENCGAKEGNAISTVTLAVCAKDFGYNVDLMSDSFEIDESLLDLEYYKKHGGTDWIKEGKKKIEEAKQKGVNLIEKELELDELLGKLSENCVPIVLVDWSYVKGTPEKGYQGHFVPLVGFNEKNVLVHNHGKLNTTEFLEIPREIFDKARTAKGTDGDILFLYNSN